jgi:hypothetical protein
MNMKYISVNMKHSKSYYLLTLPQQFTVFFLGGDYSVNLQIYASHSEPYSKTVQKTTT